MEHLEPQRATAKPKTPTTAHQSPRPAPSHEARHAHEIVGDRNLVGQIASFTESGGPAYYAVLRVDPRAKVGMTCQIVGIKDAPFRLDRVTGTWATAMISRSVLALQVGQRVRINTSPELNTVLVGRREPIDYGGPVLPTDD